MCVCVCWVVDFYGKSTLGLFHAKDVFYFILLLNGYSWKGSVFIC